jgi:hypothetical protein
MEITEAYFMVHIGTSRVRPASASGGMTMTSMDRVSVWSGHRCRGDRKSLSAVTGLTFVAIAAVSMGGCTGDPAPGRSAPSVTSSGSSSSASSPALSPSFVPSPGPSAEAAEAALAAYRGFRKAEVKAGASGHVKGSGLEKYAFDKALTGAESMVLTFSVQGIVLRGEPVLHPQVSNVDLTGHPRVQITDCFDTTQWEAVYANTGESAVAPGQARRTVVDATAEIHEKRWKIRVVTNHRDRTC